MADKIAEIKARVEAATPGPWQHFPPPVNRLVAGGDNHSIEVAACRILGGAADADLIANAPADLAHLLAELDAIEAHLASDRARLREDSRGMSTADLVKAGLDERKGEIRKGWQYASTVERDTDRMLAEARMAIEQRDAEIERLNGLVARMLPLINHSEAAGCPMAFHRSDGEQCTCGALDVVREARGGVPQEARS